MTQETKQDLRERQTPGRKSQYRNRLLFAQMGRNPRTTNTHGYRSYQIIRDAGVGGILYEDFRKAGGRNRDLVWDIARGRVKAGPIYEPR